MLCRQCSVLGKCLTTSLSTISPEDRDLLFIKSNILIPKGSRCCEDHLYNGRLRVDALGEVRSFKITQIDFSSTDVITWFSKFRDHYNVVRYFDFDPPFLMSHVNFYNLTGISKLNFEHLITFLANSNIKHSFNRSLRNAVGLFLTKLRLGISNKVLITIFQFSNPKAVARTLTAVLQAMVTNFVPYYLGFNHISRETVIKDYFSPLFTQLLTEQLNIAVLVIDGTYTYRFVVYYIFYSFDLRHSVIKD